jgi:hypothetical protein
VFTVDIDEADAATPEAARATVRFLRANEPQVRHKVAAATVELYREWHDGEAITPEALAQLITLNSVTVWDERGGDLFYAAGDLFAGHGICAPIDAGGELGEPDLEG